MNSSTSFHNEGYECVVGTDIIPVLLKLSLVSLVSRCTRSEVSVERVNFVPCCDSRHDHIQHVLCACIHQFDVCSSFRIVSGVMLGVTNFNNVEPGYLAQ